ncbi:MAG TPA: DUF4386 domain-containing protein [Candidatus Acidoferrales bacterium]|nr:DUF4386 domain-containing protein [Candidatus Acidoferrales bacterium]
MLYFVSSLFGVFSLLYVPSVVFVSKDASDRANAIQAHQLLFRAGIVSNLIGTVGFIFVALALFDLLKDVGKKLATVMVTLIVLSVPISMLNEVNHLAALKLLTNPNISSSFQKPQIDAMVSLFLSLSGQGNLIAEIFWGLWLIPFGILVYKSGFLPRILGVLLVIACFGYLTDSFASLLYPGYPTVVDTVTKILTAGELPIIFWLLIMGAKNEPLLKSSS